MTMVVIVGFPVTLAAVVVKGGAAGWTYTGG
jgi:hypothetical protein